MDLRGGGGEEGGKGSWGRGKGVVDRHMKLDSKATKTSDSKWVTILHLRKCFRQH